MWPYACFYCVVAITVARGVVGKSIDLLDCAGVDCADFERLYSFLAVGIKVK